MKIKTITVVAATTQDALAENGAAVEDTNCQNVNEAIRRAKYYLTNEYRIASESSQLLGYSQVLVNGECIHDFYASPSAKLDHWRMTTHKY